LTRRFERYVAVDWSGARGRYDGIAVAQTVPGDAAPTLVGPSGQRWSRAEFVEWVVAQASLHESILIGIDCAFALPVGASEPLLGAGHDADALWAYIDAQSAGRGDLYGGDFAAQERHSALFWSAGKRPEGFVEHRRATEIACQKAGLGSPESPLKLIGARQVGKGGLAGMRVLASLRQTLAQDFAVWPFHSTEAARIVCVELYPRLFLRMAGHGNSKVRSWPELNRRLTALRSASCAETGSALTDHEADALVAAAGLRLIAEDEAVWFPAGLDALARRAEGWIFGVP
jgi:hypothetical protein